MTAANWLQLLALVAAVAAGARLLGPYLAGIYGDGKAPGDRVFLPVERAIYRVCGVDEEREQRWNVYALSLLAFSLFSVVLLFAIQRLQGSLPLNPTDVGAVPVPLAWNTAVSFVTNTNWQNYGGESTMSHLTQMAGLDRAELRLAGRRHLRRRSPSSVAWPGGGPARVGNFWVDLVRGTVRLMIPLAVVVHHRAPEPGRHPEPAGLHRRSRPSRAPARRSRAGRSPARRRSRSSAPTAAGSSTPTRRTRCSTRTASPTCSRSS